MNESGSSRSRAMSKLMTPLVARAGVMISASADISSSLLSGLDRILKRRMTIASPAPFAVISGRSRLCAGQFQELTLDLRIERVLVVAEPGLDRATVVLGESLRLVGLQGVEGGRCHVRR